MTQHSNRESYAPWGEPVRPQQPTGWWTTLATVPALVRHLVLMFTTMAVVTSINLLTAPGTWWSLALLVIWVALVIIHGLGILSLGVLLDDDEDERPAGAPRRVAPEHEPVPHGPSVPARITRRRGETEPAVPVSWEIRDDGPGGWPDAPPADRPHDREEPASETGSWRAVTDIAWHRHPRSPNGARETPAPRRDREASS